MFLVILGCITTISADESRVYYVGVNGENSYESISEAIEAAQPGDTIKVSPGFYKENIVVDKSLTIQGMDKDATIISGAGAGNIVEITAGNVQIQMISVKSDLEDNPDSNQTQIGILVNADEITISDCVVENCNFGMIFKNSTNHSIMNCVISNNDGGVDLFNITHSSLINTEISYNNYFYGVSIRRGFYNTVYNCNFSYNRFGVVLALSSFNIVNHNVFSVNDVNGVYIVYDVEEICCDNNVISENNFFDNRGLNAQDNCKDNFWDDEVLGNYWDDYEGEDADGDGVGDTPYSIIGFGESADRYPVIDPFDIVVDIPEPGEIVITIVSPSENSTLSGITMLSGLSSVAGEDLYIDSVKIRVDGGEWYLADGTDSWDFLLDTGEYENGAHVLYVQAEDSEGNLKSLSRRFIVSNIPANGEDGDNGIPGFEFVYILLLVIFLIMIYKRR
jgi:parallel beta-helix repeat protein